MLRSMIDRTAPEPLWQQLAGVIRRRIDDGTYPPRTAIPSITKLAAEFGLSDVTVKKALSNLKDQGVLTGTPGRGTFVARQD
jgi:DNA-binding GntR family transcriptional regulator